MKNLIDRRVDKMAAEGLVEEVRRLLESGVSRDATAMQAIGYKEFLAVADGTATVEEALAEAAEAAEARGNERKGEKNEQNKKNNNNTNIPNTIHNIRKHEKQCRKFIFK